MTLTRTTQTRNETKWSPADSIVRGREFSNLYGIRGGPWLDLKIAIKLTPTITQCPGLQEWYGRVVSRTLPPQKYPKKGTQINKTTRNMGWLRPSWARAPCVSSPPFLFTPSPASFRNTFGGFLYYKMAMFLNARDIRPLGNILAGWISSFQLPVHTVAVPRRAKCDTYVILWGFTVVSTIQEYELVRL